MKKTYALIGVLVLVALLLVVGGMIFMASRGGVQGDTARIYHDSTDASQLYVTHGQQPLHVWYRIRAYGEWFWACPVEYTSDGDTILTVNELEMVQCGTLPD